MKIKFFAITMVALGTLVPQQTRAGSNPNDPSSRITHSKIFSEPLCWTGQKEPDPDLSQDLADILDLTRTDLSGGLTRLERFIADHPDSGWTPSLRADLAMYYRTTGQYTPALEHWQKAWDSTKNSTDEKGHKVADYVLVNWTSLLASLGRVEMLKSVFQSVGNRTFENMTLQQKFNNTVQGLGIMINKPGVAYKCGTFAMANVGQAMGSLNGTNFSELLETPSPASGFSMTTLTGYAQKYHLDLVPVLRSSGDELVVPSIIHWKQDHYAAIIGEKNGLYHVADPTFGGDKWLKAKIINSEASGHFFVPATKVPAGWKMLAQDETDIIFGKGFPNVEPPSPPPCTTCPCPPGSPTGPNSPGKPPGKGKQDQPQSPRNSMDGGMAGGNMGTGCSNCGVNNPVMHMGNGMAGWAVQEPDITLWVTDRPFSYSPSRGYDIELAVNYHQRETRPVNTNIYNFGPSWNCNWLTYMDVTDAANDASFTNYSAELFAPLGGESQFEFDYTQPDSHTRVQFGRILSGSNAVGFTLTYPDASVTTYGLLDNLGVAPLQKRAFLTQMTSTEGYNTIFQYSTNSGLILLTNIIDVDGNNTSFIYDSTFPSQIARVISPNSWDAHFYYNSNSLLTNIVDAVGISSQFQYASSNGIPLMTSLATPYGVTSFKYMGDSITTTNLGYNTNLNNINSAIEITEPTGGKHLFLYRDNSSDYLSSVVVTRSPFYSGSPGTEYAYGDDAPAVDGSYSENRNSFYWGPRQYDALSSPTNIAAFGNSDYKIARLRHWYHASRNGAIIDPQAVSHTLGIERQPSPDGTTEGSSVWYGYSGKRYEWIEATNSLPNAIFRAMPGWNVDPAMNLHYQEYNQFGKITKKIETYSVDDSPATISLRTNLFAYAANGFDLISQTMLVDGGRPVVIQSNIFNAYHQIVTNYDALNQMTVYTYNANQQLTSIKSPGGLTTTNIYDSNNRLIQTIDLEINRTNSYTYQNGEIYQHTNELGLVRTYSHDGLRRITSMVDNEGTVSNIYFLQGGITLLGGTGTNIIDLTGTKDKINHWTYFGYNGVRQWTATTNDKGSASYNIYCSCGALTAYIDALGYSNQFFYDLRGRLTNTVYADGFSVANMLDILNRTAVSKDSSGAVISNYFNNQGFKISSSNIAGQVFLRRYNIRDCITNNIDGSGVLSTNVFDDLNRTVRRGRAGGGSEGFAYSASGMIYYTNRLGFISSYGYDAAARKTKETNANNEVTTFAYDAAGNLVNLTDAKANSTAWHFDSFSRVTNKVDAAGAIIFKYAYDPNSRLINRCSLEKGDAYYSYDAVGNLTNITYAISPSLSFSYDADNRMTNMLDGVGLNRFSYTEVGQLASEDGPWEQDTISYTYTNRKRSTLSLNAPNASGWSETYDYDVIDRLLNITSPAGTFSYAYNPGLGGMRTFSGLIDQITIPNSTYITNNFDDLGRLTATTLYNNANIPLNYHAYAYDANNQRTLQMRQSLDENYVKYAYDPSGQVTNDLAYEYGSNIPRLNEQMYYGYDAAGNLAHRTNGILAEDFNVNNLNELTAETNNGNVTVVGTTTSIATNVIVNATIAARYSDGTFATNLGFANIYKAIAQDAKGRKATNSVNVNLSTNCAYLYDRNGNLTNDGLRNFAYDDENQLITVWVSNVWRSEFAYDGKMRRRLRQEFIWTASHWQKTNEVRYVYDGNLVIQERDVYNLPKVTYTRGKDLAGSREGAGGIGGLLARTRNGIIENLGSDGSSAHAYYHSDGNGNVTMMVDSHSIPVAKYEYDAFGNTLFRTGPLADSNLYRFSSKEWHQSSGLAYYLYRYYDPNLQRWINKDPIGERGGINLYTAVKNNLLKRFDFFGHQISEGGDLWDEPALPTRGHQACAAVLQAYENLGDYKEKFYPEENEPDCGLGCRYGCWPPDECKGHWVSNDPPPQPIGPPPSPFPSAAYLPSTPPGPPLVTIPPAPSSPGGGCSVCPINNPPQITLTGPRVGPLNPR